MEYKPWKQSYLSEFMSLKCAGDVLNVVSPLGSKSDKEVSESMGMIKRIRGIFLAEPMKYDLLDLCAGNALTSVLGVYLLPIKTSIAIDKRPRKRKWNEAKRFQYFEEDIYKYGFKCINSNTVIISIHGCGGLARRVIEIYKNSEAKALFLMPCCGGKLKNKYPQMFITQLGGYRIWCWDLMRDLEGVGHSVFIEDKKILSPKNIIIGTIRK